MAAPVRDCDFLYISCRWGGVGMGGWDSNVHVCDHTSSCLEIFSCTWSHTWVHALRSCLALDHTLDACFEFLPCTWLYTLCYGGDLLMHLTTHLMLCVEIFSCTGSHAWFYALRSTFALDHTLDATLWDFACSRWIFWNFFFRLQWKNHGSLHRNLHDPKVDPRLQRIPSTCGALLPK